MIRSHLSAGEIRSTSFILGDKFTSTSLFRFCPKGFSDLNHLKYHENIHTDSRPYKCQFCGLGFNSVGTKISHENRKLKGGICPTQKGPIKRSADGAKKKQKSVYVYSETPCEHCGKIFS